MGREGKEGHLGLRGQRDKGTKSLEGTALVLLELKVCPGGGGMVNEPGNVGWHCIMEGPECLVAILEQRKAIASF